MTTFRAIGGLGNQLFVLAAAMAHSLSTGRPVSLDTRLAARGKDSRGTHQISSNLTSLLLNGEDIPVSTTPKFGLSLIDAAASAEIRIQRKLDLRQSSAWCHTSKDLGFDDAVFSSKKLYYRGYFQSFKYLQFLQENSPGFRLTLNTPSEAYLRLEKELGGYQRCIIHVRRGDYKSLGASLGMLDASYYRRAAERLVNEGFQGRFIFFSDMANLNEDAEIASLAADLDATFLATSGLDPAEVLLLMEGADAYVIANSSFSWWAASLGRPRHVVAPMPWFLAEKSPTGIHFPGWITQESSWM